MRVLLGLVRGGSVILLLVACALLLNATQAPFEHVQPVHTGAPYEVVLGWQAVALAGPVVLLCSVMAVRPLTWWPGIAGLLLAQCLAGYIGIYAGQAQFRYENTGSVEYQSGFDHAMLASLAVLAGSVLWLVGAEIVDILTPRARWTRSQSLDPSLPDPSLDSRDKV